MDRQVLAAFFDELEKLAARPKWDPIRGRPVGAVATRVTPIPKMLPVIQTPPSTGEMDDLAAAGYGFTG
jgi:hypothetical protein